MNKKLKILILEDSPDDVQLIERELTKGGISFTSAVVTHKNAFENALSDFKPDLILSDHSLPQFNSIEALNLFKHYQKQQNISIPFILVTGSVSEEFAVQSIKAGADDYVLKDRLKRLPTSIHTALEKCRIENEKQKAEKERTEFFNILQQSLNEIYIFNADTLLLEYVNNGALKNLGYSGKEISGLKLSDIQPEFDAGILINLQSSAFDNHAKMVYETMHLRKNGTLYSAEVHLQLVTQEKHKAFVAIIIDTTERKKHLSAIEQQNEKLMEIAWIQSHKVRSPLARMMGLIALITDYEDKEIDLKEILRHIISSAHELDGLIRTIVRKTEAIEKEERL